MGNLSFSGHSSRHADLPPQSREELEWYANEQLAEACRNITSKCYSYLDSRESKVNELESKIQYYKAKLQHLKREKEEATYHQTEAFRAAFEKIQDELKYEKKTNCANKKELNAKSKRISELQRIVTEKDEEILNLKKLTDPAQQMRRKGHCIRAGDVTHEDVSLEYKELYTNRKLFHPIGITQASERMSELTKLLQLAYSCSKATVIETAKQELEKLFEMPQTIYSIDERRSPEVYQPWNSRQEALSLLLSLKGDQPTIPQHLVNDVMTQYLRNDEMQPVVEKVTQFAWKMVTLSPPVTFGIPKFTFNDDMYEMTDIHDLINKAQPHKVEYRRPVLFYGPLGTIGHKGSVTINPTNDTNQGDSSTATPHMEDSSLPNKQEKENAEEIVSKNENTATCNDENTEDAIPDDENNTTHNNETTEENKTDKTVTENVTIDDEHMHKNILAPVNTEEQVIEPHLTDTTSQAENDAMEQQPKENKSNIDTTANETDNDTEKYAKDDDTKRNSNEEKLPDDPKSTNTGAQGSAEAPPKPKKKKNKRGKRKKQKMSSKSETAVPSKTKTCTISNNESNDESTDDESGNGSKEEGDMINEINNDAEEQSIHVINQFDDDSDLDVD